MYHLSTPILSSVFSITPEGHVSVDFYILGYGELYKFLNLLGTVFGWVASDVHAKLEVLGLMSGSIFWAILSNFGRKNWQL
jgi:hypothetical protein